MDTDRTGKDIPEHKFRYFHGEKENPWDSNDKAQFRISHFWFFERSAYLAGEEEVNDLFRTSLKSMIYDDNVVGSLIDNYGADEGELAVMTYMIFGSGQSMPINALFEYITGGTPVRRSDIVMAG